MNIQEKILTIANSDKPLFEMRSDIRSFLETLTDDELYHVSKGTNFKVKRDRVFIINILVEYYSYSRLSRVISG